MTEQHASFLFDHPPEHVAAAKSHRVLLAGGIKADVGFDPDAARVIATATGDTLHWPIRTGIFSDPDGGALLLSLHSATDMDGSRWVEMSVVPSGLRICRDLLQTIAIAAFGDFRADYLVVRVRPDDLALRDVLQRLHLRRVLMQDNRHVFALAAAAVPRSWLHPGARRTH